MKFQDTQLSFHIRAAYLRQSITEVEFEKFTSELKDLLNKINPQETEENQKNYLKDFLKNSFFEKYDINTKGRIDLVIYDGPVAKNSNAAVLIEVKRGRNASEMVSKDNMNRKALWELVHYFLYERIKEKNNFIKHLIITDIDNWFVFDATEFEQVFYKNNKLRRQYDQWIKEGMIDKTTDRIYELINQFVDQSDQTIKYAYFNLREYAEKIDSESEKHKEQLIELFKFFSPVHLLKLPFANDSNTLDKSFYSELLYIIGLEEQKDKTITRVRPSRRQQGTIIEETIWQLKNLYPDIDEDQIFDIALSLVLTWINRILFLKLLESQIVSFTGNEQFHFLTSDKITEFDDLNTLFFFVLAKRPQDRRQSEQEKFYFIPFLNSSLFEVSPLERQFIRISDLNDKITIKTAANTVLKDQQGKTLANEQIPTLKYLLDFLSAYDFGTEGKAKIQKRKKTLINAAVLGLIFERINGYKDGSYFTPGSITEFIARKVIEPVVIQKFSLYFDTKFESISGLSNYIRRNVYEPDQIKKAQEVLYSIKLVDPAVGSGHFLVSALNVLVAIQGQLGLITDKQGRVITEYDFSVENDDLVIRNTRTGEFFHYRVEHDFKPIEQLQIVQEAIFDAKRHLIENALFGVDINDNSVKISRLRLWIELLKNMYYIFDHNPKGEVPPMQTLPNIDINIRRGDALISKFDINANIGSLAPGYREKVKRFIEKLKEQVAIYKATSQREVREQARKQIRQIIDQFQQIFDPKDADYKKLKQLKARLAELSQRFDAKDFEVMAQDISEKIQTLEQKLKEKYKDAFEWRFEFPEVLDDNGNFTGFDIVIGNPPYIQLQKNFGRLAQKYKDLGYKTFERTGDIYALFYERGFQLLRKNGMFGYITSNKWMRAAYGEKLREFLSEKQIIMLVDLGPGVFESATVDTNILIAENCPPYKPTLAITLTADTDLNSLQPEQFVQIPTWSAEPWIILSPVERKIKQKIETIGKPLKDWNVNIYYGIKTGYNEAFIITTEKRNEILANCKDEDERQRTEQIIKPILRGRDIKRYYYNWADLWLINTHSGVQKSADQIKQLEKKQKRKFHTPYFGVSKDYKIEIYEPEAFDILPINIHDYPTVKQHLDQYFDKLIKRYDKGITPYNLRHCAYLEEFEKEKIVWASVGETYYCWVNKNYFILDTNYFTTSLSKWQLGVLNSKLIVHYINTQDTLVGSMAYRHYKYNFKKIPIPPITKENELIVKEIEALVDKILEKKSRGEDTTAEERTIDLMVYHLYGLTYDEALVIDPTLTREEWEGVSF